MIAPVTENFGFSPDSIGGVHRKAAQYDEIK